MKIIPIALVLLSITLVGCSQQQPQPANTSTKTPVTKPAAPAQAPSAQMELKIDPQAPKSGSNVKLIVELRDAKGASISDAEVKAAFVMSMGSMGDMRDSIVPKWTGSRYEGTSKISMPGEWEVLVEASQGGKLIARKGTKIKAK